MALGVDGMRASKVVRKVICLTLGTAIFIFCLAALYESMRAVMDVGGACASGGAYEIRQACPKGVGWVIPVTIFGMFFAGIFTFLGVFDEGGPRPYVFAWSALFLALGWNFLDYGFNPPDNHDTVWGWVICGIVFVLMGGAPLLLLFSPRIARWSLWGPDSQRADDHLHPYKPPPIRTPKSDSTTPAPATSTVHSSTPYARASVATEPAPALVPTPPPKDLFVPPPATTPPKPAAESPPKSDIVERLATLADLRERGMLDDDEYEKAKNAVLGEETS
ncbi:MAG TPA: hypothetical protein VGN51_11960 [Acidimicrobiia bacterium]|jgi:hypothetical protein